MPVIKLEESLNYSWAIWEILESEQALYDLSSLTPKEESELASIHHEWKRKEYLAGRLVLKAIVENQDRVFKGIYKDNFGKPFLIGSDFHISLSHSFPFATAILHLKEPVGIDIEKPQDKLLHIAQKFLSEEERIATGDDLQALCVFWCAKEVLYKIYGRKQLTLKSALYVSGYSKDHHTLSGSIKLTEAISNYRLRHLKFNEYVICFNE